MSRQPRASARTAQHPRRTSPVPPPRRLAVRLPHLIAAAPPSRPLPRPLTPAHPAPFPCPPRRRLGAQAVATDFPPARMLRQYDREWAALHAAPLERCVDDETERMSASEAEHYADVWLEECTPYDPKTSAARQAERRRRQLQAWARNLALLGLQVGGSGEGGGGR